MSSSAPSSEALFSQAVQFYRNHRRGEAERLLLQVVGKNPGHDAAFHLLSIIAQEAGNLAAAREHLGRAIAIKDSFAPYHSNMGVLHEALGQLDDAAESCRKAIALDPAYAQSYFNLSGIALMQKRYDEAESSARALAALQPQMAEAHLNLGIALLGQGRVSEATDALDRVIPLNPARAATWFNLGGMRQELGHWDAAADCYRHAIERKPNYIEAHLELGNVLKAMGRLNDAIAGYCRALDINPNYVNAHGNLGVTLMAQGRVEEAVVAYRHALDLAPNRAKIHVDLGLALQTLKRPDEARTSFETALALDADSAEAESNLLHLRRAFCDWRSFSADEARVVELIRRHVSGPMPFAALSSSTSLADQLSCARTWIENHVSVPQSALPPRAIGAVGRIRIGYLSADLHNHATSFLAAELFERHDRSRFEIYAYSFGPDDGSAMRERLTRGFDHFIDIRALSHAEAAQRIRDDGIDILVDLLGHTQNSRTEIVAYRPTPICVNFLGFPGTMGAGFVDYILADPVVAPFADQPFYNERIVHLPECYQPNDTKRAVADTPSRASCGLPENGFVFCCLNAPSKVTPIVFDIWMRLLSAVPGSVLWLLEQNATTAQNLRREAEARGVSASRLVLGSALPNAEHVARYRLADLFLDTLPYNAHTTGSDALWAGLPVLTCVGETFAGRVGASLLKAVGLPELITTTLADYENLALRLAREPTELNRLKTRLIENRSTAPLFDIDRFTHHIEAAYSRMVERHRARLKPEAFAVEASDSTPR
ncbi:MAG TPA: tetratricopeptide repeat protein [Magnetospirillaceae bacterium]|jgi:predicted O-linked N-acetylglucosamine transferase (SPINDLY family)